MKVKDVLDTIKAVEIKVLQMHHYVGSKPTHREMLYHFFYNHELKDWEEKIYEEDFQQREIEGIYPGGDACIEIRVFGKDFEEYLKNLHENCGQ